VQVVILARAVGLTLEMSDVSVESLLPAEFTAKNYGFDQQNTPGGLAQIHQDQVKDLAALDMIMDAKMKEVASDRALR
jgi:homoserine dehydrogenase